MPNFNDLAATYTPITTSNLDAVLAVVSDAAYRDDASLVTGLTESGLAQLDLTGNGTGTYVAANAAFDAWTATVDGEPAAIIAFRGTDDVNTSTGSVSAALGSADAGYWLDTTGYYDLLATGVSAFDATVSSLGIDQVYVTGHSLGGAAAQAYMADHADTAATDYQAVVYGSLGLSGGDGTWDTDARVTAFAAPSDVATALGVQTAGLTLTVETGTSSLGSGPDLSALLSDPSAFLAAHSISLYADDAARYDAMLAGIPATDVTTFVSATASLGGLTLTVSPLG
uniref:Lipase (Class 3) n=1 Tax=Desulfovibrio sp. U5L TaxID=596152 RepID=I2Q5K8_9BACT